jgi:hypothetical protein
MKKVFQDMALPVFEGSTLKKINLEASDLKSRRVTIILLGSDISMDGAISSMGKLRDSGYQLTVVMSKAAEYLVGKERIEREVKPQNLMIGDCYEGAQDLVRNSDVVIVPNLTQNTLAKIAVGIQDDVPSMLLWQFLLQSVRVIVNTDSIRHAWFSIDGNAKMKKVMEGHIKTVADFGAVMIDHHDYVSLLMKPALPTVQGNRGHRSDSKNPASAPPRVITESWLRELSAVSRQLVLEKGMIITPLAKDLARTLGIELVDKR